MGNNQGRRVLLRVSLKLHNICLYVLCRYEFLKDEPSTGDFPLIIYTLEGIHYSGAMIHVSFRIVFIYQTSAFGTWYSDTGFFDIIGPIRKKVFYYFKAEVLYQF